MKKVQQTPHSVDISTFLRCFPDEAAAIAYVFYTRHGWRPRCPACGEPARFRPFRTGPGFTSTCCGRYLSATGGTILARTNAQVQPWLYALLLYADATGGMSHNSIRRLLGLSQGAADRLADGLRTHISLSLVEQPLGGAGVKVYIDECLVGFARGHERVVLLGLTDGKRCVMRIIPNRKATTLLPVIHEYVLPGSIIITDGWAGYNQLSAIGFDHSRVNHTHKLWVNHDGHSTAPIESEWCVIKRLLKGRVPLASTANLWKFVGEATYRYNARFNQAQAWWRLVGTFPVIGPETLETARRRIDLR